MIIDGGQMTAVRYREIRLSMNLSQAQLALKLGVHGMTISKRERGESVINREAELALRMLELETKYELEFTE